MPVRRSTLSLKRDEALSATRVSIGKEKLVYLLVADRKLSYPLRESRIAYIGTTKKGVARIAQIVAARADEILSIRGVRSFHARVVTCKPRKNVRTWHKLERAMLIVFREEYGEVPWCNIHGKNMKRTDEFKYFAERRVKQVLEELS